MKINWKRAVGRTVMVIVAVTSAPLWLPFVAMLALCCAVNWLVFDFGVDKTKQWPYVDRR